MSEYVLVHHGVKGMKWGVRKAKKDKRVATKMLSKAAKEADKRAKLYLNSSEKQRLKDHKAKAQEYRKIGKAYVEQSKAYKSYLSDIQTDKVKAGKDYIVASKWHLDFNIPLGGGVARTRTLKTRSGINVTNKIGFY